MQESGADPAHDDDNGEQGRQTGNTDNIVYYQSFRRDKLATSL
jgi:hypothetical protein